MNVHNDLPSVPPIAGENQISAVEKSPTAANPSSSAVGSDQAHLSGAASLISHAASLSEVRAEKVQPIQLAIASGSYSVSSTDVAQSLMGYMLGNQE
jgi:flagellar biosynthesis anti-sigma factor FlgM